MEIKNPSIIFLVNSNITEIIIRDNDAAVEFLRITLTPDQLSSALSRLGNTKCTATVDNLDKLGKVHENESYEFEIPVSFDRFNVKADYSLLNEAVIKVREGIFYKL